jgi:LytS/YehU family sensor histidine kinase
LLFCSRHSFFVYIKKQNKKAPEIHAQSINNSLSKHFIFNTLNNINSYDVADNVGVATDYLSKFGKLLYIVNENNGMNKITLAKEIEALKLYL